jgi:hypothetical protein
MHSQTAVLQEALGFLMVNSFCCPQRVYAD